MQWLYWSLATVHRLPLFAFEGQPYSNLQDCRRFEYEYVTWNKQHHWPKKTTKGISYLGIKIRLELEGKMRDLALFNMALDSKLQGCDLNKLNDSDVAYGNYVSGVATENR